MNFSNKNEHAALDLLAFISIVFISIVFIAYMLQDVLIPLLFAIILSVLMYPIVYNQKLDCDLIELYIIAIFGFVQFLEGNFITPKSQVQKFH